MSRFRILSLDGGGIRGLLTLCIIERIVRMKPDFLQNINMFSGTSTGGIIALLLANGNTIGEIKDLYITKRFEIFKKRGILNKVFNLFESKYSNENLERELRTLFGAKTINELNKKVLIPSFDLDINGGWQPKFFHNFSNVDIDYNLCYKIAMATSAAPTYFPVYNGYIDGGVVCNNSSIAALCQTQDSRNDIKINFDDITILSIGTGKVLDNAKYYNTNLGFLEWVSKLLSIMFSGLEGVPDYETSQLLKERYFRINPILPENKDWSMDNLNSIDDLIKMANNVDLTDLKTWLDNN